MIYKIYPPASLKDPDPATFFDINGTDYEFVDDPTLPVDIELINTSTGESHADQAKIKLGLGIFHNCEWQINGLISFSPEDCWIVTNAIEPDKLGYPRILFVDFLFNRTKAYYHNFLFRSSTRPWMYVGAGGYCIRNIESADTKTKIFTSVNNCDRTIDIWRSCRKMEYRQALVDLVSLFHSFGHVGGADSHVIRSQIDYPDCYSIDEVTTCPRSPTRYTGYAPIHDAYLRDTFISIYAETVEFSPTIAVTEKTYDPLIRGHFILPFSSPGLIEHLKNKGFLLPNFIDYSYNQIGEPEKSFARYKEEVIRLLNLDIDTWRRLWTENLHVIQHNRDLFCVLPYEKVDLSQLFI